ncbi:MAG TPA: tetratricopeptide repeat protein [Candidatus Binatia bacterium]|nr:tetratricopeptide repeat protein [Candidatus Binatia bacterium]
MTRTMQRALVVLIAGGLASASGMAQASEQSKRLTGRGLIEFHAGRYSEALQLFDQAVADDAADAYARYYRAVTRGRLNDLDGAITDLRVVLATKPDLDQAALELGVALVQTERYQEAMPFLQQAQRNEEVAAQASLFLGIAQLRLARNDEARGNFERAAADPQQRLAARYYLGIVEFQAGNWSKAVEQFNVVVDQEPNSAMGREAGVFLTRIRQGRGGLRPYQVYGSVGMQYDSNVSLTPSNASPFIKQVGQSDGRITLATGGTYVPLRNDWAQLTLGYDFYQSLHFHLTEFNLQDNGPSVQLGFNTGRAQFGVLARYDYYLGSTNSFLQEATALPWLTIPERDYGRTEISCRVRRRDFKQAAYWSQDAFNFAPSVKQFVYLGSVERYVEVGYQFDRQDPVINGQRVKRSDAEMFGYDGNEINTSFGWGWPVFTTQLGYAYRHESYDNPASHGRRDDEHHLIFVARYYANDYLDFVAGYYGTFNNSNQTPFTYDRNIGSLSVEVRY